MWDKLSAANPSIKNLVLGYFGSIFAFFYEFLYIKKENIWHNYIRGGFKIKNTIICGKSPKGGGGVRAKIKKVYISNVDSL